METCKKLILILLLFIAGSCLDHRGKMEWLHSGEDKTGQDHPTLARILESGRLTAVTNYNSTNYFIYRGEPMGYQYELLRSFAQHLGVKLELEIVNDLDKSFDRLQTGKCDLLAMDLTITKKRLEKVSFSDPINETRQALVQRKPDNWKALAARNRLKDSLIKNPLQLAGETIVIQKNTTFKKRLENLSDEIGAPIHVREHPDATMEELIGMVARKEIGYTVADEHIALLNRKYFPQIDVGTPLSFPQNIGWAVRKKSKGLLEEINKWLDGFKGTTDWAVLYNKYFRNPRIIQYASSRYHSLKDDRISEYDDIIKKYSEKIGWDWRLLASLIYQESRFDPNVRSWAGAFGLMQLMPGTARKYNVDSLSPPEEQIRAGTEFIRLLDKQFKKIIKDEEERKMFILAAYNAGIAHVYDARRLAEKYNKNPNVWNGHVDFYLLNKSKPEFYTDSVVKYGYCRGSETFAFVNEIMDRYDHYKKMLPP